MEETIKQVEKSNKKIYKYRKILDKIQARKNELTKKQDEVIGWIKQEENKIFTAMNNLDK